MTQSPYAPYPVAPQQPQYPSYPAPAQQIPQQPVYQQQPQYQGYPQPAAPAAFPTQQPPAQPLANGTLDDYYNQPSIGGGPSISWKGKPEGTSYAGIVARDVTNADVQQETDFQTKQPKFYRDGRPKFVMKVPLRVQPSQEFPDGEAVFFVKGQARDELVRAMNEAGVSGAPQGGAGIVVTLVQRKASGQGMNPANIVQIRYTPPQGAAQGTGAPSPAPVPAQQTAPQQEYAPPAQQQVPPQQATAPQQYAAPAPQQQQPAPAPQAQAAPQPPADLSPEQQQLLARLTGGQG